MSVRVRASSELNGSSRHMNSRGDSSARKNAARCCMPPDRVCGADVATSPRPTRASQSRAEARDWLARVGLGEVATSAPHTLSGGMQQRAAFLRALLSPREFMCLDEPFSSLDALTRTDMQRWLLHIWEETRRSVMLVTHSIDEALLL